MCIGSMQTLYEGPECPGTDPHPTAHPTPSRYQGMALFSLSLAEPSKVPTIGQDSRAHGSVFCLTVPDLTAWKSSHLKAGPPGSWTP